MPALRWNEDKKTATVYQAEYASVAPTQLLPSRPSSIRTRCRPASCPFPACVTNYDGNTRTFVNVSPRLGLDYHLTDT